MFPDATPHFLRDALIDSAKDRHGYLFIDRSPSADPDLCVRNFVYPELRGKFYMAKQNG